MKRSKNIVLFASGSGSNAEAIFQHFKKNDHINVSRLLSNKENAYALHRAEKYGVSTTVFNKEQFYGSDDIVELLSSEGTDLIVLAGFLWLIPQGMVDMFPNKIINIHPALLPKYGGKGMYGMHVHRAVKAAGEPESGITIHFVNEHYDEGQIIRQEKCVLDEKDSPEDIAKKVQRLEHLYYPQVIEELLEKGI